MNALAAVAPDMPEPDEDATAPASGAPMASGPDMALIQKLQGWIDKPNLCEDLDEPTLNEIGQRVVEEYDIDDTSRADWKQRTEKGMNLALQVATEKSFPWPKAANIIYPLVTTASTQFAARAYPAIINGRSVVKGVVVGPDDGRPQIGPDGTPLLQNGPNGQPQPVWQVPPGAKRLRADSLGEHMSWQLLDEMPEWEPETDQLCHMLPIVGWVVRKTYFDKARGRNVSKIVQPLKFVWNYGYKFEDAPRHTEVLTVYPREILENQRSGLWREPEQPYGDPTDAGNDKDKPHEFLEQHRWWDLDGDGYPEPYIVTVHKDTRHVCRIVARFDADGIHFNAATHRVVRIDAVEYYTKYGFIPNPDGSGYDIGFGQLLLPINEGINTVLNQMLDAATLQNAGGGFIAKGLSMNAGAIRFQLGEYKVVNVPGAVLKDSIMPLQFPGPSPVLFNLLGFLVEAGKEIAAVKDVLTGDSQNKDQPATTTLALIEQGLKVFTAIYKRVHRALKSELDKLYRLNRVYGDPVSQYKVGDDWKQVTRDDYQYGSGVEPYSDPTMVSDMQRMARAQFLYTLRGDPNINGVEVLRRVLTAADVDQVDKLVVEQAPPNPVVVAKGMELEMRGAEAQANVKLKEAQRVAAYATAIKTLAEADATVGDQHIQWLDRVLQAWETEHDAAMQPTQNADGSQGGPQGTPPPRPMLHHPLELPGQGAGNIQPHISDADNMAGTPMNGAKPGGALGGMGGEAVDPDSRFAADHS